MKGPQKMATTFGRRQRTVQTKGGGRGQGGGERDTPKKPKTKTGKAKSN